MQNSELQLKKTVLKLYAALPRNVKNIEISKATGLKQAWITDFTKGRIRSPNVDYVEKLYIYLAKKPLF